MQAGWKKKKKKDPLMTMRGSKPSHSIKGRGGKEKGGGETRRNNKLRRRKREAKGKISVRG